MTKEATDLEAYRREITDRVRRHTTESACRLNPSDKVVEALIDGLVRRKVKFGDYYCPCRVVTGNPETDLANVCPCRTHEEEIARSGKCHCGLFVGDAKPRAAGPNTQELEPRTEAAMAANAVELTDANFENETSTGVCLVDFWAEWCPPCRMVTPIVEEIAADYAGKAKICKLDTDAHRQTAGKFSITAIPTLIIFKNGKVAKRFTGVTSKQDLKKALDEALA